ncbi:MAG: glucuronate isomerase [Candidatus Ancillula sp.]|nr:glucuronate isomerase [Candidatus Ancillula sp.]
MNSSFMNDDFILSNQAATKLFHEVAKHEDIVDYHCHLNPAEILANENWRNLTHIWLGGDHYKWRLMRAAGVSEELITGDADDYDKFVAWVQTLQLAPGNPLYEWSHLELRRYFNIDLEINMENAEKIWSTANSLLATDAYRPRELVAKMNVKVVCTTDDPLDDLKSHQEIGQVESRFKVLPSFRPDKVLNDDAPDFDAYMERLAGLTGVEVDTLEGLERALELRIKHFVANGCRASDHAFNELPHDKNSRKFKVLQILMKLYKKHGIIMQFHFGSPRNFNTQMFDKLGPDTGYDAIGDTQNVALAIGNILNEAEVKGHLPTCIWYSLNPNDWMVILTVMGCFKGQYLGSAWWFNDTYEGMRDQMIKLASQSLFGKFVGMLTDSRSFLSYPRHEYFRRILCEVVGQWVEAGRLPLSVARETVRNICLKNAKELFNFGE